MSARIALCGVTGVAALAWCTTLAAQGAGPVRPRLDRGADTTDWQSYFAFGARALRNRPDLADAAFYWASRIDPTRPEPLYGRFVAYWCRDVDLFERYVFHDPKVRLDWRTLAADSFAVRAMERNPFLYRGLIFAAYERIGGRFGASAEVAAWVAWTKGDPAQAAKMFGRAAAEDGRAVWQRYNRAAALTTLGRFDSATSELLLLESELERRAQSTVVPVYESKELIAYGLGLLYVARGDSTAAIAAFGRALAENLAFAPAHAALGDIAAARRDTGVAVRELAQATELDPGDAVLHLRLGYALDGARRGLEAEREYRTATTLEPWFADARLALAGATDRRGARDDALREYSHYLAVAPASARPIVARVEARIAAIRSAPPTAVATSPP